MKKIINDLPCRYTNISTTLCQVYNPVFYVIGGMLFGGLTSQWVIMVISVALGSGFWYYLFGKGIKKKND